MNRKEEKMLAVLNQVEMGRMRVREACELLDLCLRHVRRLLAAYRKERAAALAHGNRGREPSHALGAGMKGQVLKLAQSTYAGCNNQHFTELLAERRGIAVPPSFVRRIPLGVGVKSPRKRPPKRRKRRKRHRQEGRLVQIDGACHDWLERRNPCLTLIGATDDATGRVPHALFREHEGTQSYFLLLRQIVTSWAGSLDIR